MSKSADRTPAPSDRDMKTDVVRPELSLNSTTYAVIGLPPSSPEPVHLKAMAEEEMGVAERRKGEEGGTMGKLKFEWHWDHTHTHKRTYWCKDGTFMRNAHDIGRHTSIAACIGTGHHGDGVHWL